MVFANETGTHDTSPESCSNVSMISLSLLTIRLTPNIVLAIISK